MADIEELKRIYSDARAAVDAATLALGNAERALRSAVVSSAESGVAARGITIGSRVTLDGYFGIYKGCRGGKYNPLRAVAVVMAEKKDGTAHATSSAFGFWGADPKAIQLAASAAGDGK